MWAASPKNFSIWVVLYVALGDASRTGATVVRTAVRLAPWEPAPVVGFALAGVVGAMVQTAGLETANVLSVVWFNSAFVTGGPRSVHDLAAGTEVMERWGGVSGNFDG